jgi:predicted RNA binding protein YcfA (HicA-like mRNA interferase family)
MWKLLLRKQLKITTDDIRYVLIEFGYQEIRSKGSHHAFANEQGEVIIIPKKGGQKVTRTYIEELIRLLDLENYQNDTK